MMADGGTSESVVMVGAGNVASHLAPALQRAGYDVRGVVSRSETSALRLANELRCTSAINVSSFPHAHIYILCTSDDALPRLAAQLAAFAPESLLIHTSGSTPLSVFGDHQRCGVLYPLQTFSRHRAIDFDCVPLFVEGCNETIGQEIETIASRLSHSVCRLDSNGRARLHLAAVFACNFVNRCAALAADVMEEAGQDWNLLLPLIDETADKLHELSPREAQTGPAARADRNLIERQRRLIASPDALAVYDALTYSILTSR